MDAAPASSTPQRLTAAEHIAQAVRNAEVVHPLLERSARAISDWHTERDWPEHLDQAIRTVEAVAEVLHREGYRDASTFLRSAVWKEPSPRQRDAKTSKGPRLG